MTTKTVPVYFPVWNFAHRADPYMASIRRIRKTYADDPEREAVLIGSVFHVAQAQMFPSLAETEPLREVVNA